MVTVDQLLQLASKQIGKPYVFGVEVKLDDPNPASFDCSELVQWVCCQAAVQPEMPDGSWIQYVHCRQNGRILSVDDAIGTRGALLFTNRDANGAPMDPTDAGDVPPHGHVAFSMGNGQTIEAMGTKWGVVQGNAAGRSWTQGGVIPGVDYASTTAAAALTPADPVPADPVLAAPVRSTTDNHPWLEVGADGDEVAKMQRLLLGVGAHSIGRLSANGKFSELTDIAVRLFQWYVKTYHDATMEVDGKCGPITWGWLEKLGAA
jgi:cell wall-associated NlpC family hydrolase